MTARAYLRYSPRAFHEKVVVDGYPPGAYAAFNAVLCLAEEQPERGRFRSEKLLRLMLDEPEDGVRIGWGKWVRYLIDHGDLMRQDRGSLYVVGWDEWQEGDVTVAERMTRLRAKKSHGADRNGSGESDTPSIVTVPSERRQAAEAGGGGGSRGGGGGHAPADDVMRHGLPHIDPETAGVLESATGLMMTTIHGWPAAELDRLCEQRSGERVRASVRRVVDGQAERPSWEQLVGAVRADLEPPIHRNGKVPAAPKGMVQSVDEIREALRARS